LHRELKKINYQESRPGVVVDPKGVFTDVCIGWPGSMPDDQVLEKSMLSIGCLKFVFSFFMIFIYSLSK
jgi:hypothetical protein